MANVTHESRQEHHNMQGEHHSGVGRYLFVFVALLFFTGITVWTGRIDLKEWNLPLALLIATTKAALVALYFMHLADHQGANRMVFGVSILFVLLLLFFPLMDIGTRPGMSLPAGSPKSSMQSIDFHSQGTRFGGTLKQSDSPAGTH